MCVCVSEYAYSFRQRSLERRRRATTGSWILNLPKVWGLLSVFILFEGNPDLMRYLAIVEHRRKERDDGGWCGSCVDRPCSEHRGSWFGQGMERLWWFKEWRWLALTSGFCGCCLWSLPLGRSEDRQSWTRWSEWWVRHKREVHSRDWWCDKGAHARSQGGGRGAFYWLQGYWCLAITAKYTLRVLRPLSTSSRGMVMSTIMQFRLSFTHILNWRGLERRSKKWVASVSFLTSL